MTQTQGFKGSNPFSSTAGIAQWKRRVIDIVLKKTATAIFSFASGARIAEVRILLPALEVIIWEKQVENLALLYLIGYIGIEMDVGIVQTEIIVIVARLIRRWSPHKRKNGTKEKNRT